MMLVHTAVLRWRGAEASEALGLVQDLGVHVHGFHTGERPEQLGQLSRFEICNLAGSNAPDHVKHAALANAGRGERPRDISEPRRSE